MCAPQLNRSVVALLLITLVLGTVVTGCKSNPRSQRETALLCAEILDLEDQFYSMKSRYEAANRELQVCRGAPVDGTYLGSTAIEGDYVEGGFVDGDFVEGEYMDGPFVESNEYGPSEIIYDVPARTGRYIPHATETFRDSARRIFGRNSLQGQASPTQSVGPHQRSFGLFNRRGSGLFRRNQAAGPAANFSSDTAFVAPPLAGQPGMTRAKSASTPTLATDSANRRGADRMFSDSPDAEPIDLDIRLADEPSAEYSPQDNVIFDDVDPSYGTSINGPASGQLVTQIDISSSATHGEDVDGQPGHEGVVVLIQPKDRNGVLVKETGEVTVSLIDPAADGDGQRIGLWKFTPQEMRLFEVKNERSEQGFLLHLPWDGHAPSSQELLLYVRYWTNDGRRLETSTRLSIDPPGNAYSPESPLIEGWTRRDTRWDKGSKTLAAPSQPAMLADDPRIPNLKSGPNTNAGQTGSGRGVKATPASSNIKRPAWRPSR